MVQLEGQSVAAGTAAGAVELDSHLKHWAGAERAPGGKQRKAKKAEVSLERPEKGTQERSLAWWGRGSCCLGEEVEVANGLP